MQDSLSISIKLDVEGFKDRALRGLVVEAYRVQFIIAEVSVTKRFEDSYNFSEFTALALKRGFVFDNILNHAPAIPRKFYDVLFLRSSDPKFIKY